MTVVEVLNFLYDSKKFTNFEIEFITDFELGKCYKLAELYLTRDSECKINKLTENVDAFHTYFMDRCVQIWISNPKAENFEFYGCMGILPANFKCGEKT